MKHNGLQMMNDRHVLLLHNQAASLVRVTGDRRRPHVDNTRTLAQSLPALVNDENALEGYAQALGRFITEKYPDGLTATLVIPSHWCLLRSAAVPVRRFDSRVAAMELEPQLPSPLENYVYAARRTGETKAVVACVHHAPLQRMFGVFEKHGLFIESIYCEADVLASAELGSEETVDGIIVRDGVRTVLVRLDAESREPHSAVTTANCSHKPDCSDSQGQTVQVGASTGPTWLDGNLYRQLASWPLLPRRLRIYEFNEAAANEGAAGEVRPSEQQSDLELEFVNGRNLMEVVTAQVVTGRNLLNLRNGPLLSTRRYAVLERRLFATGCALVLLVAIAAGGLRWKNHRIAAALAELQPQPAKIYKDLFPDSPPPAAGAALRLHSERIKLEGLTSRSPLAAGTILDRATDPLRLLRDLVLTLPENLKLNMRELLIDDGQLVVSGGTTSHAAAGLVVQALNGSGNWECAPPETKLQKDQTVDFRIAARRLSDEE